RPDLSNGADTARDGALPIGGRLPRRRPSALEPTRPDAGDEPDAGVAARPRHDHRPRGRQRLHARAVPRARAVRSPGRGGAVVPDMTPGVPSALSPLVRRIVAPNPGPFTGPGTNTYLVGIDEVAVIDPGPDDAGHIDAIIGASMKERVRWVLL